MADRCESAGPRPQGFVAMGLTSTFFFCQKSNSREVELSLLCQPRPWGQPQSELPDLILQSMTNEGSPASAAEPTDSAAWLTTRRFTVLLGLLIFVAYPQVVTGFHSFVYRDF